MKARIQKKGNFFSHLILDFATDKVEYYTHTDESDPVLALPFKGFYEIIDNHLIILYKTANNLLSLKVDDLVFNISDRFSIRYFDEDNYGFLNIKDEYKEIKLRYSILSMGIVSTLFYSEEEEDVNFGLWLANVLNSGEKIAILLDTW